MKLHLLTVFSTAKVNIACHDLNTELWIELTLLPEMLRKGLLSWALLPWTLAAHVVLSASLLPWAPCPYEH